MSTTIKALLLCLAIGALAPRGALAHGGIPVSESIVFRGDTLFVPVRFWGVFFGTDGGPWRWICEEAINSNQARKWAIAGDGSFHVTNYKSITSSRDGGCTWVDAGGELGMRATSAIVADPATATRVWATTNQYDSGTPSIPWNALFRSDDSGVSWTPTFMGDEFLYGVALSSDGMRIYVIGSPRTGPPVPVLHVSQDGGKTFNTVALNYSTSTIPTTVLVPMAVDPVNPDTFYVRAESDPTAVLLRGEPSGQLTEILRSDGKSTGDGTLFDVGIGGLEFEPDTKTLWIASTKGIYKSVDGAMPVEVSNLTQSQCIVKHSGSLYACSWDYMPDLAAVARSNDDGVSFRKIFQYNETVAPIDTCPAGTPVQRICPGIWQMYADQLGVVQSSSDASVGAAADSGADAGMAKGPLPANGCGCRVGASGKKSGDNGEAMLLAVLLAWVANRVGARRQRAPVQGAVGAPPASRIT